MRRRPIAGKWRRKRLKRLNPRPGNSTAPASPEEPDLSPLAEAAQAPCTAEAPATDGPEMAPQTSEKALFAPEDQAPASSDEAFTAEALLVIVADLDPAAEAAPVALADPAPATEAAPAGPTIPAPAGEVVPLTRGPDPREEAFSQAEAAPPPPAIAANVLLPPHARAQPGPTAFTGSIRCGGRVTYYL